MSNCKKLLGAAVFFVLGMVVSSRKLDLDKIAYEQITVDEKCIESRVDIISRLLDDIDGEPIGEIFPHLIQELKQNMTASADTARFLVDYEMNSPQNTIIFNRTECKRFFAAYAKEIDDVETRLDEGFGNALNKTIAVLRDVLTKIRKELNTVKSIKSQARLCKEYSCNQLVIIANAARERTFTLTTEFVCPKRKYSSYMRILVQMEYNAYAKKIPDVLENTKKCIRGGNLSIRNNF